MRVTRSVRQGGVSCGSWVDHNMRTTVRYRDVATPDHSDPEFEPGDDIGILHEIGSRIAAADPLHAVLSRVVQFITTVIPCDSAYSFLAAIIPRPLPAAVPSSALLISPPTNPPTDAPTAATPIMSSSVNTPSG